MKLELVIKGQVMGSFCSFLLEDRASGIFPLVSSLPRNLFPVEMGQCLYFSWVWYQLSMAIKVLYNN